MLLVNGIFSKVKSKRKYIIVQVVKDCALEWEK